MAFTFSTGSSNPHYDSIGGAFEINGTAVHEIVAFRLDKFSVSLVETGLPGGTEWSVSWAGRLINSDNPTISFVERDGTYPYVIRGIPGWTTPIWSGTISINDAAAVIPIVWVQTVYQVQFTQTGLPPGFGWWVNVSLTPGVFQTGPSAQLDEPNGTYYYSITSLNSSYNAPGGSFELNGTGFDVTVAFKEVTFSVTFSEIGLPPGTNWSVTLGATTGDSVTSTILMLAPNGSLSYSVSTVSGYVAGPDSGTVSVIGGNATQHITFSVVVPMVFNVTFYELGLPAWWYMVRVVRPSGKVGQRTDRVPGYRERVLSIYGRPRGIRSSHSHERHLQVNGTFASQSVRFAALISPPTSNSGLSTSDEYILTGVIVAFLAGLAAIGLLRMRKRKSP